MTTRLDTIVDEREALFNDRARGPIQQIQIPLERITRLHGIMFDLDPKILIPGNSLFAPGDTPRAFYENIRPVLDRHPLAKFGEIRASGTGLHLIVWFKPAVELMTESDQKRWGAIVKVVQRTLPVDPCCPGITACTRPIGAVNSKNGAKVELLKEGKPVAPTLVEEFIARLDAEPFKTVAVPLLGAEKVRPCPFCLADESALGVLSHLGMCYPCGKHRLEDLLDRIYRPIDDETTLGSESGPACNQAATVEPAWRKNLITGVVSVN